MNRLRQRLFVRALEDRTAPATFTVMNLNDSGADSLRDCVSKANATVGEDTVSFNVGLTGTITLTTTEIAISEAVTIIGPGSGSLSISGNDAVRILDITAVPAGFRVLLLDLTLTKGRRVGINFGGAINGDNQKLEAQRCDFTNNFAASGGAVQLSDGGKFTAIDCTFSSNSTSALGGGGAISISGTTTKLDVYRCTFTGNSAPRGGAISAGVDILISDCTFSGNSATTGEGGAIQAFGPFAAGKLRIINSTISGNTAGIGTSTTGDGGGIGLRSVTGTLELWNCTVTGNTAKVSGGGIARTDAYPTIIAVESSIVSSNVSAASPDIFSGGTVTVKTSAVGSDAGFSKTDQGGNLPFGTNLKLGPLADNGGPTLTHLPANDSPLIDVGSNPTSLMSDQRGSGFQRTIHVIDIGAIEGLNLVVRNTADSGFGSLRQTLLHANSREGADTISFDSSFSTGTNTIAFASSSLSLPVTGETSIIGPGSIRLAIQGFFGSIFDISNSPAGTAISISGLTLTNGFAGNDKRGGAIRGDDQKLSIDSCQFNANVAGLAGGAIALGKSGVLTVTQSSFTNNSANVAGVSAHGGAISAHQITATDCTFDNNSAESDGGAIGMLDQAGGSLFGLRIERCTLSNNSAKNFGGGVFISGAFAPSIPVILNSTLSTNSAGFGGGIRLNTAFTLQLFNSTIVLNNGGGGVHVGAGTLQFESSIVAKNSSFDLKFAALTNISANHTFVSSIENSNATFIGVGNFTGSDNNPLDAKLGPLADNGGFTKSHQPQLGSPVLNAGNNTAGLANDQRGAGFPRIVGNPDIGAVEVLPTVLSLVPSAVTVADAHVGPDGFTVTATYNMAMNTAVLPTVSFPVEVPAGSIVFSSSVWNDNTTFVTKFNVADLGTMLNNIDLKITGGVDAITAIAASSLTVVDAISLDTQNPFLTSIASSTPNGTYGVGQSINITLNLSEAVTLTGTLNVTLDTGAVVSITGPASGTTLSGAYVIGPGQNSSDLNVTALALTGGSTLRDTATNNTVLTLPALNLANTANIVVSTPAGVSGFVVNDGDAQRSRLTKVVVSFSSLVNAATLAGPGGVTFTRTAGAPTGTVVDTSNGLIVSPMSGMVSSVTLMFANVINAGVESGSLADGRWQLAIPEHGFTSPLNDPILLRFFGDMNGDGAVANNDFIVFRQFFNGANSALDFDNDGSVSNSDFVRFRSRFNGSI